LAYVSRRLDVRSGSKADICNAIGHVRFATVSGHVRCNYGCPLWAKSGHYVADHYRTRCDNARMVPCGAFGAENLAREARPCQ